VAVQCGQRDRVAETEAVELERLEVLPRVVDLVGEQEHGFACAAEDLGHLLVSGRDAGLRVDDEEHQVGLGDCGSSLVGDRARDR
jgi:hypothetical protein